MQEVRLRSGAALGSDCQRRSENLAHRAYFSTFQEKVIRAKTALPPQSLDWHVQGGTWRRDSENCSLQSDLQGERSLAASQNGTVRRRCWSSQAGRGRLREGLGPRLLRARPEAWRCRGCLQG